MTPWSFGADLVRIEDDLSGFTLIQNRKFTEFVNASGSDSRFFVVATKGVGKTLLLKYKSIQYRHKKKDFAFVPPHELCEKLTPTHSDIAFAQDDLALFTTS